MHFKANKLLAYRKVKRNKVFNILLASKGIRMFDAFFFVYTRVIAFIHSLFCYDESRGDNSERELMLRLHKTGPDPVRIESDRISFCLHNNNNNNNNNKKFLKHCFSRVQRRYLQVLEPVQNSNSKSAGPVLDPFESVQDRFQNGLA